MPVIGKSDVGPLGYGCMNLTWKENPTPDPEAFETLKTAFNSGFTFWNAGEFYGGPKNLELLSRFFTANPDYKDKILLSVKGGIGENWKPHTTLDGMRSSVENIKKLLGGAKKLDLFEPARLAPGFPVEEIAQILKTLRDEGHFDYVGLSEVSLDTLKKIHAIVPVAAVELEASPASPEVFEDGTLKYCEEAGITLVGYSPLARGLFTSQNCHPDVLSPGDLRSHFDRFQKDTYDHNYAIVQKWKDMAEAKKVPIAALVIAWIIAQSKSILPIPGSSRVDGVLEVAKAKDVTFSESDLETLNKLAFDPANAFKGSRYNEHMNKMLRR